MNRLFELAIALMLIALNGLLSLPKLAVVSSRKSRPKTMAVQEPMRP